MRRLTGIAEPPIRRVGPVGRSHETLIMSNGRRRKVSMNMPEDADALSPDWLTARLAAAGAVSRARISSVEIEDVGEHGMTGHLVRLRLSYDRPEPGAPSSLVAKFSA